MAGASLETRPLTLPIHYWARIEAEPEVKSGEVTVEEWIRRLIYSQFSYFLDLEDA